MLVVTGFMPSDKGMGGVVGWSGDGGGGRVRAHGLVVGANGEGV